MLVRIEQTHVFASYAVFPCMSTHVSIKPTAPIPHVSNKIEGNKTWLKKCRFLLLIFCLIYEHNH